MAKYRITGPDGATYEINAPDGASEQDVLAYAQSNFAPASGVDQKQPSGVPAGQDRSAAVQALRYAGLGSKGFADSALETLASPLEISGKAASALGISDYKPGTWTERLKSGYRAVGQTMAQPVDAAIQAMTGGVDAGPATPETGTERFAYGAGRGAADVGAVLAPAAMVARGAQAGSLAQRLGSTLAEAPKIQLASGMVGGGVSEATDSPIAGVGAALAVPTAAAIGQRIISPVENQLTPELRRLAGVAQTEGIPLTAAQQTGSRPLKTMESVMGTLPFTAGPSEAIKQTQREAFNRAVLKRAGVEASEATPEVLNRARTALGGQFTELSARNNLSVTDNLVDDLARITDEVGRFSVPEIVRPVQNRIEDILSKVTEDGTIPGKAYREIDSAIGRTLRSTTNGDLRNYLGEVRDALRTAMDNSIAPTDQQAWQQARRQYANLMTIARAMNAGTGETVAGNVSPAQLMAAVRNQGNNATAFGRGDLQDMARIGQAFVRDPIANSGTPERTIMAGLLTAGGGGFAAGLDPMTMAAAGGAALSPRVIQMIYNTPLMQRYLTNELMQRGGTVAPVALNQAAIAAPQAVGRLTDMLSR